MYVLSILEVICMCVPRHGTMYTHYLLKEKAVIVIISYHDSLLNKTFFLDFNLFVFCLFVLLC